MSHIVLIGAYPPSLINFRGDLIRALVSAGHKVTAMSESGTEDSIASIEALGADFKAYPVQKSGLNPFRDFQTFQNLVRMFGEMSPDYVFAYTIKPVIWSGIALRFVSSKTSFFALITGLGYSFHEKSIPGKVLSSGVSQLYRMSLNRADGVIFQNAESRDLFVDREIARERCCHLVNGSGVNLDHFADEALPETQHPVFLLIARLIREKGIYEYVDAAREVKRQCPDAEFCLLGKHYNSPGSIARGEVEQWQKEGVIHYLGTAKDVRPFIAGCHVFVLPSYYKEGMSRSIMEALALGRPILTTDNPGCREMVIDGGNGFIVPTADTGALAERMIWLIENRHCWKTMGKRSREIAEREYDVHRINRQLMKIMGVY